MTALDFPASPTNGQVYENYVYDSTAEVWKRIASGIELNGISDVTITSATTDQLLRWSGTEWINGTANTNSIADDAITAAKLANTAGAVMVFDDDAARTTAIPSPTEGMTSYLDDVNQVQVYDGSGWKPVGGLVAFKSVLKTNIFSASVASGASVNVTDLSISHAVSNSANKVVLMAQLPISSSDAVNQRAAAAFYDGTNLINIGDAAGSRSRVSAMTLVQNLVTVSPLAVYSPGSTSSVTYTVRLICTNSATTTLYLNRPENDGDGTDIRFMRTAASFTLMEVAG
jgi:hypothetical protein